MKIAIDFDDVVTDFTATLMDYYHKEYGKKVRVEEILIWDWGLYWEIPREEAVKRVNLFHENYRIEDIPQIEYAIESLNSLMKENEIIIITNRPSRFKNKVEEWLKHHLNRKLEIIHAGDFHKHQAATKAEICKELGIKIILEDSGETAIDCASNDIKVILFDKPWNKKYSHDNIYRVKNWKEAVEIIDKLPN